MKDSVRECPPDPPTKLSSYVWSYTKTQVGLKLPASNYTKTHINMHETNKKKQTIKEVTDKQVQRESVGQDASM